MALRFSKFIIESQNPSGLYHFLSFIFDVEAEDKLDDEILFEFEDLRFLLKGTHEAVVPKLDFTLAVESFEELKQLSQNVEFYYYKEGKSAQLLELKPEMLIFSDPDGRQWQVELASSMPLGKAVRTSLGQNTLM